MYKESEVNLDEIVKALLESELGFLLLQSDNDCKKYIRCTIRKKYIRGQAWDVWL